MEINFDQVKQFIESNKENSDVTSYFQGLNPLTVEGVQKFLGENQDAKKWLDSEKDKHFNKGLSTWMEKTFPSKLDEEIKKRYPDEDPKDKELKEIKLKLQQMEQEKVRESLKNKALSVATEKKIPVSVIDLMIGRDEEATLENLKKFEEAMSPYIQLQVEDRMKNGSYTPPNNNNQTIITLESLKNMNPDEINKLWENPTTREAISKAMSQK